MSQPVTRPSGPHLSRIRPEPHERDARPGDRPAACGAHPGNCLQAPPAMLHCSVICSLMIAIFICEQPDAHRLVDVVMPSYRFPDSGSACAVFSEQCA
ncbi:hypothetical protein OZ13_03050 [Xanthomonas cannabis pv. cannabis]|nr:hypothetical protein OZ13_03050 [Xanthomonas cannabis pv. cannabis]